MQLQRFPTWPVIGIFVFVYFIAGKFGLMLASLHVSASPVWPPAGIALAGLLMLGYRVWPAIFIGAFLVNATAAGNVATSLAIAIGNTLEAVCGAWLVNRFAGGTTVFDRPRGVFKFALAAAISTIISPAFGVTSLALVGFADWANYGAIWLTWWLGDTTGDLLIAPVIILWSTESKRRWNRREAVEVGILVLLLFVLSEAVFGGWITISARNYPIAFISAPIVIWTAFRFTQRETATSIFILSAIAIWGAMHGVGPFAGETENQSLLALQSWMAVLTISAMALSAGMAERGRAEEALRESEARVNLAAETANLGLWVWNIPGGDERWVTEKWRQLFGFADSEPVTFDRFFKVVHPGDRERVEQVVQRMLEHGGKYEIEYRVTRPDGSIRWIASHGSVEFDEDGKPALARGVSRDITKRKIAELAARQSEERLRLVIDTALDAVITIDAYGAITHWNAEAEKIFGWTKAEATGKQLSQIIIPLQHRAAHERGLRHYRDTGAGPMLGKRIEITALHRGGREFPVELSITPAVIEGRVYFTAFISDITERKQAELEHQRQNLELARVGRVAVMGELAASLAHEVNNPIGAIVANASAGQRLIAAGKIETKELKELLDDILADGRRAGEIIQGIRNMVRKGEARRELIQIEDVIRELLRVVQADAIAKEIKVATKVDSDLGQVWGDPVQLLQVLLNLTINAFEAMSAIRPDARRLVIRASPSGNGEIFVSVRDSGAGFPSGMAEQLFEPFFSTKADGTGMGLAISRSIIEDHGGTLSGENCDNGGACFTVCLPEAREGKSKTV